MINLAYCDDNEIQREILSDILSEFTAELPVEMECHPYASGRELLSDVKSGKVFDIFILDLIMPDINGMETATTLRMLGETGKIIFLTASLEYAVQSYEVQAYYYMLKPVDPDKLTKILRNAVADISDSTDSINIRGRNGNYVMKLKDLMYVDVEDRGLRYHTRDGRTIECPALRGSFKDAVSPISADRRFTFCGASILVNLHCIDALDSESLLLADGTLLYPPKSAYSELKKHWKEAKNS